MSNEAKTYEQDPNDIAIAAVIVSVAPTTKNRKTGTKSEYRELTFKSVDKRPEFASALNNAFFGQRTLGGDKTEVEVGQEVTAHGHFDPTADEGKGMWFFEISTGVQATDKATTRGMFGTPSASKKTGL